MPDRYVTYSTIAIFLRRKYMVIMLVLLGGNFVYASSIQNDTVYLKQTITGAYTDFEVDNLGNLYMVTRQGSIRKLNSNFDSIGNYNLVRRYGELKSLDVSNPLRVLLFYKDFGTVVILDRFLQEKLTLDLRTQGIMQPGAIAQSFDNNIWVWDDLDSKLLKLADDGKMLLSSPDFRVVYDVPPQATSIVDYNRYVYAYDSTKGLLVMDYYGAFKTLLPFTHWQFVHNAGKGLIGWKDKLLWYYDPNFPDARIIISHLPELTDARKIRLQGARLFVLIVTGEVLVYDVSTD